MTATLEPPPKRRSRIRGRLGPHGVKIATGTSVLVALASSIVALGYSLWPSLKPDPGDQLGAQLTVLAVERYVTVEDWLRRTSVSAEELADRRREWQAEAGEFSTEIPGFLAYVRVALKGLKGDEARFSWAIYDHATQQRRAADPAFKAPKTIVPATAPSDEFVLEQPLPAEAWPKRYFVRFEVRTQDGVLLAIADSKPFRGLQG